MVFLRDSDKYSASSSDSEISSDSKEEDLEYLIDGILKQLSVFPSKPPKMTIKNRKERSKHDRPEKSSNSDITGSPVEESLSYGFQRYQFTSEDRSRQNRPLISSTVVHSSPFQYSSHKITDSIRPQCSLKRPWSHESSKKVCNHIDEFLNDGNNTEVGNNSEDEYYHIPDNNTMNPKSEDNGLEQLLKEKKGWKVIRVRGDGACLFRSVSHQVFGDEEQHKIIRKQVVDYMYKNREHFSQYVTEDFDRYLTRKSQPTCYGNHLEIQAISELYNRPVEIYYNNVIPINVFHAEYAHEVPIRLGYYGRTHYNSIIDPYKPSFGQGLGMPNYQPLLPEKDLIKQALCESETFELEEAMLRDKLAETETRQLEDCLAEQALRESLYERAKSRLDVTNLDRQRYTPPSTSAISQLSVAVVGSDCQNQDACSSSALLKPSSSVSGKVADTTRNDFAVLQYIPPNMLDMNEDDVLAMVLEQSRSDYLSSLRTAISSSPQDPFPSGTEGVSEDRLLASAASDRNLYSQPTTQSYFRQHLDANKFNLSSSSQSPKPGEG